MSSDPFEAFRQTFFEECDELLVDLDQQLDILEEDLNSVDSLHSVFRAVHSIKAGAATFDLKAMVTFTHETETWLDDLRSGKSNLTPDLLKLLRQAVDSLASFLDYAKSDEKPPAGFAEETLTKVMALAHASEFAQPEPQEQNDQEIDGERVWNIQFIPKDTILHSGNEPTFLLRALSALGECKTRINTSKTPALEDFDPEMCNLSWAIELKGDCTRDDIIEIFEFVEDECSLEITAGVIETYKDTVLDAPETENVFIPEDMIETVDESPQAGPKTSQSRKGPEKAASIRVDVDRVDRLVNMVGELVISQSMLAQEISENLTSRAVTVFAGMEQISSHIRELQETVMAIRMQPVGSVFSRMPRIVREISQKLGKDVRLIREGEETEVDKTVIEELMDPLVHMLRNALDHGIESPEERAEAGKPAEGTIILSAEHAGGRIVIRMRDDGKGINREAVLKRAQERGLVSQTAELSNEEIDQLIFEPGFSTAAAVTDLSGRGVGMDVVRRNIQSLGGRVFVISEPGKGTTFQLSLPLTLAVLDGMVVRIGGEKYVIPISSIIETSRPSQEDLNTLPSGQMVTRLRGDYIPIVPLWRFFDIADGARDPSKALVVFVEAEGGRLSGLLVDELLGQQQVVIKSLEANYRRIPGFSAATILGDGGVYLIIDVDEVASRNHPETPLSLDVENGASHAGHDHTRAVS